MPSANVVREAAEPLLAGGDAPGAGGSLFATIHRLLRGRYVWAWLLGIAGAAGGGYLGWTSQQALYRAEGLILIAPTLTSPQDPAGTNVMPMFSAFVAVQAERLQSPEITDAAMHHGFWRETKEGLSPEDYQSFVARRSIVFRPDGQHIQVFFTDPSPDVARAGVRALIEAYKLRAMDQDLNAPYLENATSQAKLLEGWLREDSARILELSAEFGGVEGLEMRLRASVTTVLELGAELRILRGMLLGQAPEVAGPKTHVPKSPREIGLDNPRMAADLLTLELLEEREKLAAQPMGEEHPELVALRQEIAVRRRHVKEFADDYNKDRASKPLAISAVEDLKAREASLAASVEEERKESQRLGRIKEDIEKIQAESADHTRRLERFNAWRDQLSAQQLSQGRISTPPDVVRPRVPFRDRRKSTAAVGFVLGGGLGVLLIVLVGLMDRRLRSSGDISHSLARLRLLGLLPELPSDLVDPRGGEMAAHCVHQIRTLLQIRHTSRRGACLSVTGPGVGSGKTTLSLALGLSFGHAGSRTVLVDADLTGRGLTRRVGHMLLAHARHLVSTLASGAPRLQGTSTGSEPAEPTTVTRAPLVPAKTKEEASRRLLEPLVSRREGAAPIRPSDLTALLDEALRSSGVEAVRASGLLDDLCALSDLLFQGGGRDELAACLGRAIATGPAPAGEELASLPPRIHEFTAEHPEFNGVAMERYLYPTGLGALRFLPLRGLGAAGGVSVLTLEGILERLRSEFEVTLVDTGPVPGAVEAPMVAAQADAVVLVVSLGDHRPDAERAVEHLESVGAHLAGVVFNRAAARDVLKASRSRSSTPAGDDAP